MIVSKNSVGQQSAFVILVALLAAVMIPAVAAFQGLVATLGEDTGERVISRHYEFLIPLFLLAGFSLSRFVEPIKKSRLIQAGIVFFATIYSVIWLPSSIVPGFSDSSMLMGLLFSTVVFFALAAILLVTVSFWVIAPARTFRFIALGLAPLIFVTSGLLSQARLYESTGVERANFDVAGQAANTILRGVKGEDIVVAGVFRPSLFTAMFWIDIPGTADLVLENDGEDISSLVGSYSYVVVVGSSTVKGPNEVLSAGDGYQLIRLQK
jgi:hypothetical protein